MFEIAGVAVSFISLAVDLPVRYSDWAKWKEEDLLVDGKWLALAISKGKVDGAESDYSWSNEDRVATRELEGTHSVVMPGNEKKRIKYRIVRKSGRNLQVLVKRLEE